MKIRTALPIASLSLALGMAALAACSPQAIAAPASTSFLPGLYETTTTFADGTSETKRHCAVSNGAANDTLEKRLAAMSRDPSCTFTQRSVGGGKFAIAATCSNDGAKSSYRQSGTYSPTTMSMAMSTSIQAAPGQAPVSMSFKSLSRRVAATCPAGTTEE